MATKKELAALRYQLADAQCDIERRVSTAPEWLARQHALIAMLEAHVEWLEVESAPAIVTGGYWRRYLERSSAYMALRPPLLNYGFD